MKSKDISKKLKMPINEVYRTVETFKRQAKTVSKNIANVPQLLVNNELSDDDDGLL